MIEQTEQQFPCLQFRVDHGLVFCALRAIIDGEPKYTREFLTKTEAAVVIASAQIYNRIPADKCDVLRAEISASDLADDLPGLYARVLDLADEDYLHHTESLDRDLFRQKLAEVPPRMVPVSSICDCGLSRLAVHVRIDYSDQNRDVRSAGRLFSVEEVVSTADEFMLAGFITQDERDKIVADAAHFPGLPAKSDDVDPSVREPAPIPLIKFLEAMLGVELEESEPVSSSAMVS